MNVNTITNLFNALIKKLINKHKNVNMYRRVAACTQKRNCVHIVLKKKKIKVQKWTLSETHYVVGAGRSSEVGRGFAHGAMGRRIDPSWIHTH